MKHSEMEKSFKKEKKKHVSWLTFSILVYLARCNSFFKCCLQNHCQPCTLNFHLYCWIINKIQKVRTFLSFINTKSTLASLNTWSLNSWVDKTKQKNFVKYFKNTKKSKVALYFYYTVKIKKLMDANLNIYIWI